MHLWICKCFSIFWSCQLRTMFYAETFWFCGNGGLLVLVSRRTQRLFKTALTITYAEEGFYALSISPHLFRPNFACVTIWPQIIIRCTL